jgi:hypothetical protein
MNLNIQLFFYHIVGLFHELIIKKPKKIWCSMNDLLIFGSSLMQYKSMPIEIIDMTNCSRTTTLVSCWLQNQQTFHVKYTFLAEKSYTGYLLNNQYSLWVFMEFI